MKKMLSMILVISLLLGCSVTVAEDLGVQVIGGKNQEMETLNLDDMKLEEAYKIEGYATVKPLSFNYCDYFAQYNKDKNGDLTTQNVRVNESHSGLVFIKCTDSNWGKYDYVVNASWYDSGESAEYAFLMMDIVNRSKADHLFMAEASVKVIYDDEYEFAGWIRQINYDYFKSVSATVFPLQQEAIHTGHNPITEKPLYLKTLLLHPGMEEPVGMMYTGHYIFGCTLPNEVILSKESLRMVITLGDNELTYNIRK